MDKTKLIKDGDKYSDGLQLFDEYDVSDVRYRYKCHACGTDAEHVRPNIFLRERIGRMIAAIDNAIKTK